MAQNPAVFGGTIENHMVVGLDAALDELYGESADEDTEPEKRQAEAESDYDREVDDPDSKYHQEKRREKCRRLETD